MWTAGDKSVVDGQKEKPTCFAATRTGRPVLSLHPVLPSGLLHTQASAAGVRRKIPTPPIASTPILYYRSREAPSQMIGPLVSRSSNTED